jgi:phytoene dehydrogenase-like protein
MENNNYDAIVVGAGISGIMSALAMAKHGKKVLVLERSGVIGGNCRTYEVNGYKVDTGPHAITGLSEGATQEMMDKYFTEQPTFVHIDRYYARDGKKLQDIPLTITQLADFDILSRKDRILFFRAMIDAVASSSLPLKNKKLEKSVYDYIKKYPFSPKALHFIDALAYFLSGKSMEQTPAWRMLGGSGYLDEKTSHRKSKGHFEKIKKFTRNDYKGHGYPLGGIQSITDCALKSMPEKSVDFKINEKVLEILVSHRKVTGVRTEQRIYKSNLVIYSGFVKNLPKLIPDLDNKYINTVRKINQTKSLVLWLGLKEKVKEFDYVGSEVYFNTNTPYWAIPVSNFDPNLAPKNRQLIGFSTIMQEESEAKQLQKLKRAIYKALPNIKSKVEFEHTQITIPEKGALTIGVEFPSPRTHIEGLYLVGTDTDMRSMGVTRASHSVLEFLKFAKEDKIIK